MINPDDPSVTQIGLWRTMVNNLTATLGYEAGRSLRAAPYDFELYGDECYSRGLFERMRLLIEDTHDINGGRPVR